MRVLITGMTSRQTNRSRSPLSLASMIAGVIEAAGHTADVRRLRSVREPLWDYDAVIMGLSSPLAPSARYTVTGLFAMQDALESGLLRAVLVDDPDVRKVWHGAKSALDKPDRLWSTYYSGRPGVPDALGDERVRSGVLSMIEWIQGGLDGTVQLWWPAHAWASDMTVKSALVAHGRSDLGAVTGIDPTALVLESVPGKPMIGPGESWIEDMRYSSESMVFDPSSTRYCTPIASSRKEDVDETVSTYRLGYGVVQGLTGSRGTGGWWTPTPALAALAGRIYVPSLKEAELMGGPYYHLPSELEYLDARQYADAAAGQMQHLKESSWSMDRLSTEVLGALGA